MSVTRGKINRPRVKEWNVVITRPVGLINTELYNIKSNLKSCLICNDAFIDSTSTWIHLMNWNIFSVCAAYKRLKNSKLVTSSTMISLYILHKINIEMTFIKQQIHIVIFFNWNLFPRKDRLCSIPVNTEECFLQQASRGQWCQAPPLCPLRPFPPQSLTWIPWSPQSPSKWSPPSLSIPPQPWRSAPLAGPPASVRDRLPTTLTRHMKATARTLPLSAP